MNYKLPSKLTIYTTEDKNKPGNRIFAYPTNKLTYKLAVSLDVGNDVPLVLVMVRSFWIGVEHWKDNYFILHDHHKKVSRILDGITIKRNDLLIYLEYKNLDNWVLLDIFSPKTSTQARFVEESLFLVGEGAVI